MDNISVQSNKNVMLVLKPAIYYIGSGFFIGEPPINLCLSKENNIQLQGRIELHNWLEKINS